MKDDDKTREQLVHELSELRSQNAELEKSITGNRSAELAVEEACRYAESIINTVREPLIALDQDLRVVSVSHSFYEVFKVKPKETVGQLIYDLGNKQWDIPKLRELLETILPQNTTVDNYEVEHDFPNIGRRIMLLNARQIKRVLDKERIILLAIEDITEHKRLESLLTESEERYRRLFETASDGIVLLEKHEGNITHANPAIEKMLGYSIKECIGTKLQDVGVLLDRGDFQTTMQNLNQSGILNYNDIPIKTKSGQHIDTDIYLVDRARLVQCNIRDITERKKAEEALRKSGEHFKAIIQNSSDIIFIVDKLGTITYLSPSVEQFLGFEPDELIGKRTLDLIVSDDKPRAIADFGRALLTKEVPIPNVFHIRHKNGTERILEGIGKNLLDNPLVSGFVMNVRDVTERKKVEETLLSEKQLSDSTINSLPGIFYLFDDQRGFQRWNKNFEKVSGYSAEEMSRIHPLNFFTGEDKQLVEQAIQEVFTKGENTVEAEFVSKDGRRTPYLLTGVRITIGNTKCLIGMGIDITDRKRVEEALRSEQMMLARTEGIAHVGSWEWDIVTDTVTWSDELFRIFQRDPREGAPSFAEHPAFYHPDDMARLRQAVETAVADGTPYELELRAIRKDGETRVCMASGVAQMALGGRVVRLFGSLQDITERKQAEVSLRESDERYKALFDRSLDLVYLYDFEGRFIDANDAALNRLGYKREEIRSLNFASLLSEDQLPLAFKTLQEIRETGIQKDLVEFRLRHKNGSEIYVDTQGSTVMSNGTPVAIQAIARDITERKRADEKLSQTLENLRKAVEGIIQVISSTVEIKDPYTAGHQRRVADLAWVIAQEVGFTDDQRDGLRMAGTIHDLGKISIPAEILAKPTKLSDIEYKLIQAHSQIGYDILKEIEFPWQIAEMVLQHHERMNGSGYPRGLKGEAISLEARILMVADVVEAMASYRPYRPALGIEAALEELEKNKGILYDPEVVEVCLKLFKEKGFGFE